MINPISFLLSISSLFIFLRILQRKIEPDDLIRPDNPYKNVRDSDEEYSEKTDYKYKYIIAICFKIRVFDYIMVELNGG